MGRTLPSTRRLFANLLGLTAVACSNLFMGGPPAAGGSQPVPQADPSEVLMGVALTVLSQFIGAPFAHCFPTPRRTAVAVCCASTEAKGGSRV